MWLLPRVRPDMYREAAGMWKRFAACLTDMLFLTRMRAHVISKGAVS